MSDQEGRRKGLFGRMFPRKEETPEQVAPEIASPAVEEELIVDDNSVADDIEVEIKVEEVTISPVDEPVAAEAAGESTPVHEPEPEPAKPEKRGWFSRLKNGLSKSSNRLTESISGIFTKRKLDEDTLQELEDILIQADLGVDTAMRITERLAESRLDKNITTQEVQEVLADEVSAVLEPVAKPLETNGAHKPFVILVVGVNGAGKTTTIGKMARKYALEGKKVMMAAGDTFRAAAVEQLVVWGERTGAPVITRDIGADAAGLAFDAMRDARDGGYDILMMDTAGRLQNKAHLMEELKKIHRVMKKHDETAPHAVLLVLDATTGQNALNQVQVFKEAVEVTGLVMTKLDGSARGGILVAISDKFKLPVHYIGVGEGVEDLQSFEARDFARAIAQL